MNKNRMDFGQMNKKVMTNNKRYKMNYGLDKGKIKKGKLIDVLKFF